MMVIGRIGDQPYVIHDTTGGSCAPPTASCAALRLNGVVGDAAACR